MNNFDLIVGDKHIRACLFNIPLHTRQHFVNMLATITHAAHSKHSNLPAILFIDFGNRHLELVTHARHQRFDNLAFIF